MGGALSGAVFYAGIRPEFVPPVRRRPVVAHTFLADYPVVVRIPVQWGEMDAYGHVNNTVFFRYFETVRMAYLDRCGFLATYDKDKIGAILHSADCRFRRPLFSPDTAEVGGRVVKVEEDRFTMAYRVVSATHEAVVADGTAMIVSFDYAKGLKTVLPQTVRDAIATMSGAPRRSRANRDE